MELLDICWIYLFIQVSCYEKYIVLRVLDVCSKLVALSL